MVDMLGGSTRSFEPASQGSVLEVRNVRKVFEQRADRPRIAVRDVSFDVAPGECVGLVGESGSGKSTIANMILRLTDVSAGQILLKGSDITQCRGKALRDVYRSIQVVFQNPTSSFDPRRTLGYSMAEGLKNAGRSSEFINGQLSALMQRCGLPAEIASRYPHEVSGGQCQRAAIVRALALEPDVLICDEATSALDVTVQKDIIDLLADLRKGSNMAMLFICHDIALVQSVCDRVVVLRNGEIVEQGATGQVLHHPKSDYVKTLISAVL